MDGYDSYAVVNATPEQFTARKQLRPKYGFAIPTEEAIRAIVPHSPIIEIGAGLGYWAWLIEQAGGTVVATDIDPVETVDPHADRSETRHTPYERSTAEQMHDYPAFTPIYEADHLEAATIDDFTLMLIWPTFHETWAGEALERYEGDTLIYVGEGRGMATGDEGFHEQIKTEWMLDEFVQIPTWPGIHDRLEIYERKQ